MRAAPAIAVLTMTLWTQASIAQTPHEKTMLGLSKHWIEECRQARPICKVGPSSLDYNMIDDETAVPVLARGGCVPHAFSAMYGMNSDFLRERAKEIYKEIVAISAAKAASQCGVCPSDEFWESETGKGLMESGGSGDPKLWDQVMKQCHAQPTTETVERSASKCGEDSPYNHWKDLLNFTPSETDHAADGTRLSNPDFEIQRLDGDYNDNVNLDDFSVRIDRIPPRFESPEELFDHFRRHINSFFDNDIATMRGINRGSSAAWQQPGPAPIGSIQVFDIPVMVGHLHEQGAVIVTQSSATHWIFSTVTVGVSGPGEHPVSGHREFGIRPAGGGAYELYVRAADRVTGGLPDDIFASDADVIAGGKALWRSFQQRVADFINGNRGEARVNEPRTEYPLWNSKEIQECL